MHVDENAIIAFVDGNLSPLEVSQLREHLDGCPDCLALVAVMVKDRAPELAPTIVAHGSHRASAAKLPRSLAPGAHVGPYVIERLLGAGGMGVVYAARDPRLDRTVALKLIRQEHGSDTLAERLRRESKALARLSHPNVTVVYELGAADDEIYVAMEYVDGKNLRAWLRDERPTRREILATYTRAGRGLAAAHAAGLVHRDFKPDNVLIAADRSVKVTDFGLARLTGEVLAPEPGLADGSAEQVLTMTGAVVGTPAYMAPEQFGRGAIDARADQFAFCVSLFEALYGARPFRGDSVDALRVAVLAGKIDVPRARVAPRIRRALLRGLSADAEKRFPSMQALLAAIAPRRGRVTLAVAGLGVPAAAAIAALTFARPTDKPCRGAGAEIARVWNPEKRANVRAAFIATHAAAAEQTWNSIEHGIDTYASAWTAMHVGACEATRVHREQSEAVLDMRMACLEHRRSELDALLSVFGHADAVTVSRAREAMIGLGEIAACADVEALSRRAPLPTDAAQRKRYESLRARIDRTKALANVARFKEALPELVALEAETKEFPALEAEAAVNRAYVLGEQGNLPAAEQTFFRALVRGQAARADDVVAHAAIGLAYINGRRQQRATEGLRWADFAAAAIAAKGGDDLMTVRVGSIRGTILDAAGRLPEAEAEHRKALELVKRRAPDSTLEGEVLDGLGITLVAEGKTDEAIRSFERALAIRIEQFGAIHALTASTRTNLANVLASTKQFDRALAEYKQVLAIDEQLFGPEDNEVSTVLSNMGQMLQEAGRLDEARPPLERALAIRTKALGADDPAVARPLANLGYLELDQHAYAQALDHFTRADAVIVKALGEDHASRIDPLEGLGTAHLASGQPRSAIAPFDRAVELREKYPADPVSLASLQGKLAQALWKSGRDRARASKLAATARKALAEEPKELAELKMIR